MVSRREPLSLSALQHTICHSLLGEISPVLAGMVRAHGEPAAARIDVHRNNLTISLTATLAAAYPVTCRMLGEEGFADVAGAFIRWQPPITPCLSAYGDGFDEVVAAHPAAIADPFLADLARVEWALHSVAHAPDPEGDACFHLADLQQADPARIFVRWHPAVRYVRTDWAIDRMLAAMSGFYPEAPAFDPRWLEIVRQDRVVCFQLQPGPWTFRCSLARGGSLMDAVREALAEDPFFDLLPALRALAADGFVTKTQFLLL
jgi:Putative DNA-binding domain